MTLITFANVFTVCLSGTMPSGHSMKVFIINTIFKQLKFVKINLVLVRLQLIGQMH